MAITELSLDSTQHLVQKSRAGDELAFAALVNGTVNGSVRGAGVVITVNVPVGHNLTGLHSRSASARAGTSTAAL